MYNTSRALTTNIKFNYDPNNHWPLNGSSSEKLPPKLSGFGDKQDQDDPPKLSELGDWSASVDMKRPPKLWKPVEKKDTEIPPKLSGFGD